MRQVGFGEFASEMELRSVLHERGESVRLVRACVSFLCPVPLLESRYSGVTGGFDLKQEDSASNLLTRCLEPQPSRS